MENLIMSLKWIIIGYISYSIIKSAFSESSWSFTKNILSLFSVKMFLIVIGGICIFLTIGIFLYEHVSFLQWSWTKYVFGSSINITYAPMQTGNELMNKLLGIPFLLLLMVAVPQLAYREEKMFRESTINHLTILWKSFVFGMIHCIVGIPLAAGIALVIPGLLLGYVYRNYFIADLKETGLEILNHREFDVRDDSIIYQQICDDELLNETFEKNVIDTIDKTNSSALALSTSYHCMWNWIMISIVLLVLIFS